MKKQTAVEWLEQQFNNTFYVAEFGEMGKRFTKIFEQAKAMEKEQISNAYVYGSCYGIDLDKGLHPNNYFKETYKGGEQ